MENLTAITKVIKNSKLKSEELLTKMLPIMEILVDTENEISKEIIYNLTTKKKDKITLIMVTEWAQEKTSTIINDAEVVKSEIDNFAKTINSGGSSSKSLKKNMEEYPFLAEVWFGDVYDDKIGIDALKELLDGIIENIDKADEDSIIQEGTDHFNKK